VGNFGIGLVSTTLSYGTSKVVSRVACYLVALNSVADDHDRLGCPFIVQIVNRIFDRS